MVSPDGAVSRMADVDTNDLLLGLDPATPRAEHVAVLEPGATLVFYTDGLVERRDRDVDDGVTELTEMLHRLTAEHLDVDELCDRLLAAMIGGKPEDDVALLVVRLAPDPPARRRQVL
jgi:serine phosphatase RsbU (regulator of sigma subunit)